MPLKTLAPFAAALAAGAGPAVAADAEKDRAAIAALDTAYQAAVERNDADAMAAILHEEMILVVGAGTIYTGADLIRAAREQDVVYARQVEDKGTQTVRLYGADTAIVTARLWLKGESKGQKFDKRLWFSDTYVRTADGWKYAFGQSSIALPAAAAP